MSGGASMPMSVETSFSTMSFAQLVVDLQEGDRTLRDAVELVNALGDLYGQPETHAVSIRTADVLARKATGPCRTAAFKVMATCSMPRCAACGWLKVPDDAEAHARCNVVGER